jgi:hypothetical protein
MEERGGCTGNTKKGKRGSNHENTKIGKHEKGKGVHETLFFRAFVLSPAPWNAVVFSIPLGCFRDEFLGFHSVF